MSTAITYLATIVLLVASSAAHTQPMDLNDIPDPLLPWVGWVLHEHSELSCPVRYNDNSRSCIWPGDLQLDATSAGAAFRQALTVYRESEVRLPGDSKFWPSNVRAGKSPLAVVERNGKPHVLLPPGSHQIAGEFRWSKLPAALSIAVGTGIVRYTMEGRPVRHPQIRSGSLWLGKGSSTSSGKTAEDQLTMAVYRLIQDGHPGRVITQLEIEVSGAQREMVLGKPIIDGFVPVKIASQLPARLEPDGSLRVQVRPGRWVFRIHARAPASFTQLALRSAGQPTTWPRSEVWVYRSSPKDRLTEIDGVRQIDPRQVRLPDDWLNLPAYQMSPDSTFNIQVIRRGDPEPEPDRLSLARDLWLDFDGAGLTVRDQLSGRMTSGWRLSADDTFQLGRVLVDGKPQLITKLAEDSRDGVEVRRGALNLAAESRYEGSTSAIPAVGWGRDFQQVTTQLHLPPGYQLLAVSGVDNVPASWLQSWTLYDIFLVLIITLAAGKLWGWVWSPIALLTVGLIWHEFDAPRMVWLYLLAVVALLRVVPPASRLLSALQLARWLGLLVLLATALPFMVQQAREGVYPQLEQHRGGSFNTAPTVSKYADSAQQNEAMLRQKASGIASDIANAASEEAYLSSKRPVKQAARRSLDAIDPSATVQTGPGLPNWRWRTAKLQWNGPVAADQKIGVYLIGPWGHLLLNFVMILLLSLLAWRVLDLKRADGKWRLGYLLAVVLTGFSANSGAATIPSPEMLEELAQRLTEPATQPPRAAIPQMSMLYSADKLRLEFTAETLQQTAIPLPVDSTLIMPVRIRIDGANASNRLLRTAQNELWLLLPKGRHRVELQAYLPPVDQLQVPLPLRPRKVVVSGKGWSIDGIDKEGRPGTQLSMLRIRGTGDAPLVELAPSILPPFLRVERTLRLGIRWEVATRVVRVSPLGTPVSLKVPIVPGGAVVTEDVTAENGKVLVNLRADQREMRWLSRLSPVDILTLEAPANAAWLEAWRADIGPMWHASIDGIAPIHHQDSGNKWLPTWHPWPGEQVTFGIQRPQGVAGNTATIDQSQLIIRPGKRAADSTLSFQLRASQGGRRDILLPTGAQLQSVKVNGKTQPIRQEGLEVSLPVTPGTQSYELSWRQMQGIESDWRTPALSLGDDSVNARLTVHTPRDRWTLWASGPRLGPAVLFWSLLSVLLLVSFVLTRGGGRHLPVGFATWLFLGIGLTQVSVFALILVAAWFFAIHYRSTLSTKHAQNTTKFNLLQALIVLLSVGTASVLLGAVETGLLGQPAMQIQGNGSSSYVLHWYQDRVTGDYPQATVVSVPLWVYRALMMAWALWLAFSLLSWVKWGWRAFSSGGLWRSFNLKPSKPKQFDGTAEAQPPAPTAPSGD